MDYWSDDDDEVADAYEENMVIAIHHHRNDRHFAEFLFEILLYELAASIRPPKTSIAVKLELFVFSAQLARGLMKAYDFDKQPPNGGRSPYVYDMWVATAPYAPTPIDLYAYLKDDWRVSRLFKREIEIDRTQIKIAKIPTFFTLPALTRQDHDHFQRTYAKLDPEFQDRFSTIVQQCRKYAWNHNGSGGECVKINDLWGVEKYTKNYNISLRKAWADQAAAELTAEEAGVHSSSSSTSPATALSNATISVDGTTTSTNGEKAKLSKKAKKKEKAKKAADNRTLESEDGGSSTTEPFSFGPDYDTAIKERDRYAREMAAAQIGKSEQEFDHKELTRLSLGWFEQHTIVLGTNMIHLYQERLSNVLAFSKQFNNSQVAMKSAFEKARKKAKDTSENEKATVLAHGKPKKVQYGGGPIKPTPEQVKKKEAQIKELDRFLDKYTDLLAAKRLTASFPGRSRIFVMGRYKKEGGEKILKDWTGSFSLHGNVNRFLHALVKDNQLTAHEAYKLSKSLDDTLAAKEKRLPLGGSLITKGLINSAAGDWSSNVPEDFYTSDAVVDPVPSYDFTASYDSYYAGVDSDDGSVPDAEWETEDEDEDDDDGDDAQVHPLIESTAAPAVKDEGRISPSSSVPSGEDLVDEKQTLSRSSSIPPGEELVDTLDDVKDSECSCDNFLLNSDFSDTDSIVEGEEFTFATSSFRKSLDDEGDPEYLCDRTPYETDEESTEASDSEFEGGIDDEANDLFSDDVEYESRIEYLIESRRIQEREEWVKTIRQRQQDLQAESGATLTELSSADICTSDLAYYDNNYNEDEDEDYEPEDTDTDGSFSSSDESDSDNEDVIETEISASEKTDVLYFSNSGFKDKETLAYLEQAHMDHLQAQWNQYTRDRNEDPAWARETMAKNQLALMERGIEYEKVATEERQLEQEREARERALKEQERMAKEEEAKMKKAREEALAKKKAADEAVAKRIAAEEADTKRKASELEETRRVELIRMMQQLAEKARLDELARKAKEVETKTIIDEEEAEIKEHTALEEVEVKQEASAVTITRASIVAAAEEAALIRLAEAEEADGKVIAAKSMVLRQQEDEARKIEVIAWSDSERDLVPGMNKTESNAALYSYPDDIESDDGNYETAAENGAQSAEETNPPLEQQPTLSSSSFQDNLKDLKLEEKRAMRAEKIRLKAEAKLAARVEYRAKQAANAKLREEQQALRDEQQALRQTEILEKQRLKAEAERLALEAARELGEPLKVLNNGAVYYDWHGINLSLSLWRSPKDLFSILESWVNHWYSQLIPNNESIEMRHALLLRLQTMFNSNFPGKNLELRPFGSLVTGLGNNWSDIDICVFSYNYDPLALHSDVTHLANMLRQQGMQDVVAITDAKVPIVKFIDPTTNIACDMNIQKPLGIYNSRLIRAYLEIDDRLGKFLYILKYFAKAHSILDGASGFLCSYAYILMAIVFFQEQKDPILPRLQNRGERPLTAEDLKRLKNGGQIQSYSHANGRKNVLIPATLGNCIKDGSVRMEYVEQDGKIFDCSFDHRTEMYRKNPIGSLNRKSVAQLLFEFFEYYARKFDYRTMEVSSKQGKFQERHLVAKERKAQLSLERISNIPSTVSMSLSPGTSREYIWDSKRELWLNGDELAYYKDLDENGGVPSGRVAEPGYFRPTTSSSSIRELNGIGIVELHDQYPPPSRTMNGGNGDGRNGGGYGHPFGDDSFFCVMDPFILGRNVGGTCRGEKLGKVWKSFDHAYKCLALGEFAEAFQPIEEGE
ncbi:hypothetical protein BGZ83_009202 [Gryganskiella cystojenkinii]|nr:hypothetical protein BGZ83_009202 [Gryganskiella cystojenkinii]